MKASDLFPTHGNDLEDGFLLENCVLGHKCSYHFGLVARPMVLMELAHYDRWISECLKLQVPVLW
jgi:hypothetical protein